MRAFKLSLLGALLALALTACSQSNGTQQNSLSNGPIAGIYGGDLVQADDSVSQSIVGLYSTDQDYLCTGSLISDDLVITAAHCVQGDLTKIVVLFGNTLIDGKKLGNGVVARKGVDGRAYPGFDMHHITETGMNDVGLIRFAGGIPAGYKPATLLVNYAAHVKNGTPVVMAGYGISSRFLNTGAGTLRKATLQVQNANLSPNETSIVPSWSKGICSGDSGGPAYLAVDGKYALWGITSRAGNAAFGLINCVAGSTFTRIDSFWSFFQKAAGDMGSSLPSYPAPQN